jgi:hypothetical protein
MQTFLAKCTAFAVLLGGFFVTGDFTRLAERGAKLLNSTTVPDRAELPSEPLPAAQPSAPPRPLPVAPPQSPATQPQAPAAARSSGVDAPLGRRVSRPLPPADSPALLELAALRAGDRLLIWVGRPASNATVIAFDIVDPVAGEALEHRHLFEDDRGAAVHAVPRRVRLAGEPSQPLTITKGGAIRLLPLGIVHGAASVGQPESLGPVLALEVK